MSSLATLGIICTSEVGDGENGSIMEDESYLDGRGFTSFKCCGITSAIRLDVGLGL